MSFRFYIGLHHPSDAQHFDACCISINRIRERKSAFSVNRWIMDSGAFTEISTYGGYRHDVAEYAAAARLWSEVGRLEAIVAQDWMCEPWIIQKTGLSVDEHQRLTVERYDALVGEALPAPVLPVLQGFLPTDYLRHVRQYSSRLRPDMWVGVGSVCKRNGRPSEVATILATIKSERPDLRLHGFGLKKTALLDPSVRVHLHSADSMAWSYSARKQGRNGNDWREAKAFEASVMRAASVPVAAWQLPLPLGTAA